MKKDEKLNKFFRDKYILISIVVGIVFLAIAYGIAYVDLFIINGSIILKLNIERQISDFISVVQLKQILIGFMMLFLIGMTLSRLLYFREKILAYFVSFFSVWEAFLCLVFIYFLNILN